MNLNLFKSPSSSSHSFIPKTAQNWKCLHIRNRQYTESVGRKPRSFSPLGFDNQINSDHKTQKVKLCSVGALKRYLNEKNLIHGRVMATTSKFSPQTFETCFRKRCYRDFRSSKKSRDINEASMRKVKFHRDQNKPSLKKKKTRCHGIPVNQSGKIDQ